jgi:YedE family putative selenium metabolism protein
MGRTTSEAPGAAGALLSRLLVYPEGAGLLLLGALFGAAAFALVALGNPASSGLCASCFLVNVAGALGLHAKATQAYLRPEVAGIVLGAFFAAFGTGEFRPRGGASPLLHFVGGAFLLVGCEVFIGCPIKAIARTAAGGAGGLAGLAGIAAGAAAALPFLSDGFSPGRKSPLPEAAALTVPLAAFLLLAAGALGLGSLGAPPVGGITRHAPFAAAAAGGLFFGAAGQRSRFCVTGGFRDAFLARSFRELAAPAGFLAVLLLLNVAAGAFSPTVALEAGAHTDLFWAFLAMAMVGFGAVLLSGCPFRQLVLASSGDLDSLAAVAGMFAGAAAAVRLGLASSPAGVTDGGKGAVLLGFAFFLVLAALRRRKG